MLSAQPETDAGWACCYCWCSDPRRQRPSRTLLALPSMHAPSQSDPNRAFPSSGAPNRTPRPQAPTWPATRPTGPSYPQAPPMGPTNGVPRPQAPPTGTRIPPGQLHPGHELLLRQRVGAGGEVAGPSEHGGVAPVTPGWRRQLEGVHEGQRPQRPALHLPCGHTTRMWLLFTVSGQLIG